jgi:esterase/lipase
MIENRLLIICLLFTTSVIVCFYSYPDDRALNSISSLTSVIVKQNDSSQWLKITGTKKIKGVALVVHGLNLKPERMQSIITELNATGIDVLNLSLRGHGNNYLKNNNLSVDDARLESFRTATYDLWLEEMYDAYLKVRKRADNKNVPVFFVGYSIGALMGCDLMLLHPDVFYDRMIFFAPALNVTMESYLLKALMPFPNVIIDSLSPTYYRSNKGTPMAAYKALFEAIDNFNNNVNDKLNKPTLIFIDEKDEFVSCSKLNKIITQLNLDHWKIEIVRKDNNVGEKVSHHLMIDKESVGKQMWKQMKGAIKRHLSM